MGIFDDIKHRIFGTRAASAATPTASAATPAASTAIPTASATPAPTAEVKAAQQAALDAGMASANKAIADAVAANTAATAAAPQNIDVAAILDAAVAKSGQKLHWKTSIVDLLKALDLDSSLTARKQLADELDYTGDKSDSAAMNIWLHKQVITKLAANGGKLPPSMLA